MLKIIRNDLCSYSDSDIPRVSYFHYVLLVSFSPIIKILYFSHCPRILLVSKFALKVSLESFQGDRQRLVQGHIRVRHQV